MTLNPTIATALSPSTTKETSAHNLSNAFKTLENFVCSRTEGVKLKNYSGQVDRTSVVAQSLEDMGRNSEAKWAHNLLRTEIQKPGVVDKLIGFARKSEISATILAHFAGKDRKDRKNILSKCGTSPSTDKSARTTRDQQPKAGVSAQRPLAQVVITTCNIFDQKMASQVVAAMSNNGINGAHINRNFAYGEPVGSGN